MVCSLLYTFFYARGQLIAWLFGAIASILFLILVARKGLIAEIATHGFYLLSAIYGYLAQSGRGISFGWTILQPLQLKLPQHLFWIAATAFLGMALGFALSKNPRSKMPYFDAQTTVFSILATVLMVRFDPTNWIYWIVIDTASAILYSRRKLLLSALLYGVYTAMAIYGLWTSHEL